MPNQKTPSASKKAAKKNTTKVARKAVKKVAAKKAVKKIDSQPVGKSATKPTRAAKKTTSSATDEASSKKTLKKVASTKPIAPQTTRVASAPTKADADDAKPAPIVFSFEDVEQLMAAKKRESKVAAQTPQKEPVKTAAQQPKKVLIEDKPHERRKLGAASLADILGFNPTEKKKNTALSSEEVPEKLKKYYKLLIDLRSHVRDEIDLHSSDTLKHSSRDDSGDLSGYGSHEADTGTDNFDRDFALSLVSNEHEALNEIEDAIQRIKKGTYGICEVTGKPIPAARLNAVPFARYSLEGQAEYEKNLRRKIDRGGSTGLFGDTSDAPKISADDDDE